MKNVNFDSLTNIKAPDAWIENALNVPQTQKQKPILFISLSRTIAAVACLILVSVISITIYLTQDRIVPPIDPDYVKETTSEITQDNSENNDKKKENNSKNPAINPSGNINNSQNYEDIEPPENGVEPTRKPTDGANKPSVSPTESSSDAPIIGPTLPSIEEPSEDPTEEPSDSNPEIPPWVEPTECPPPVMPTVTPTEAPTEAPTESPTEAPTESPTEAPTENSGKPSVATRCTVAVPIDYFSDEAMVYCVIYDSNGNILGSSNPYAYEKRTTIYDLTGEYIFYEYRPVQAGVITKKGTYTYQFYDKYATILRSGTLVC